MEKWVTRHPNVGTKFTSKIRATRMHDEDNINVRKYVELEILNEKIKLQLDTGSDLTIINLQTWRKLNRPTMIHTQLSQLQGSV